MQTRPFVVVQLSDPHLGATWAGGDAAAQFAAAVESARSLVQKPDAILLSGDLADHAADDEYEQVMQLLAPLAAPAYALPGNHDDRSRMRRHFDLPGTGGEPAQYTAELGPLRLIVLDSTRPGEDDGELGPDRLAWLDAALAADQTTPTIIAMHHPPLTTGMPAWDGIGLPLADRLALGEIVATHAQVRRIVTGHLHRAIAGELAGRSLLVAPSTYAQAQLDFDATKVQFSSDPLGFTVHTLVGGELVSYVQPFETSAPRG